MWRPNETLPLVEEHRPPLVMLPYTEGVSEDVRWVCRKFGMNVIFRTLPLLHADQSEAIIMVVTTDNK